MPKFPLLMRDNKFFILFDESARNVAEIASRLKIMLDDWDNGQKNIGLIRELEHKGDTINHDIIALVNRTFVTPFDREDIALLAHTLDDIADFIESSADSMLLYKIPSPTARAKELVEIIVQITQEVKKAITEFRQKINLKNILQHTVEINRLENMADKVYRSALAELFQDSQDIPYIIKWREIYDQMEAATDRCEDVASVLEGVALKYS